MGSYMGVGNRQFYVDDSGRLWDSERMKHEYHRVNYQVIEKDKPVESKSSVENDVELSMEQEEEINIDIDPKLEKFAIDCFSNDKHSRKGLTRGRVAKFLNLTYTKKEHKKDIDVNFKMILRKFAGRIIRFQLCWYFKENNDVGTITEQ